MNLTSQYIAIPKSRDAYTKSLATYKSIRPTSTRLRMSDDRCVLNSRKKRVSFQVDGIGFNMLYCPRGKFMMGKRPMIIERPFLLGETEVTQELFETIMGYNPSEFQGYNYPNSNQRPVEMVNWYEAVMFCNKLSLKLGKRPYYIISNVQYKKENNKTLPNIKSANVKINPDSNGFRLPYAKEWEYATKAGTNNQWAGTNDVNKVKEIAWFRDNSNKQTHHVKGKRPNEWGFYDMSGNVIEWTMDKDVIDPTNYTAKGGSFSNTSCDNLKNRIGFYHKPNEIFNDIGFRVTLNEIAHQNHNLNS